jgi:hypothetical protein
MTSMIGTSVAREHLADGQDNIMEAVKTIKRVLKSFPHLESDLANATTQLNSAKESLRLASDRLPE